jgi:hypothetical protein
MAGHYPTVELREFTAPFPTSLAISLGKKFKHFFKMSIVDKYWKRFGKPFGIYFKRAEAVLQLCAE